MKKLLLIIFLATAGTLFAQADLPENTPALINEAQYLLKEDPTSLEGRKLLRIALESEPNNEQANYLLANSHLTAGASHIVKGYISKAITANPENIDYRWIRARCNLTSAASMEDFAQAIRDLQFMAENGAGTAKVYANLALAERELAREWKYKTVPANKTWTDDKSKQETIATTNLKEALTHYEKAKAAATKAIELEPEYSAKISVQGIEQEIETLNNK
jgi:hypothetical protein